MTDRERRLRERIDRLTDERDAARAAYMEYREKLRRARIALHRTRESRDTWHARADEMRVRLDRAQDNVYKMRQRRRKAWSVLEARTAALRQMRISRDNWRARAKQAEDNSYVRVHALTVERLQKRRVYDREWRRKRAEQRKVA